MGTRSITAFYQDQRFVGSVYVHWDGNPTAHGAAMVGHLNNGQVTMVSGIGFGQDNPTHFNGVSDLAAYLIARLKKGIGGVYLEGVDPRADEKAGELWTYLFDGTHRDPCLRLTVLYMGREVYAGPFNGVDLSAIEDRAYGEDETPVPADV